MSHQEEEKEKVETYTPKMKPGDVEIPNRVFVKGFSKDTVADDLFARFEEFGKVIECRIVADRYGNSKGSCFPYFLLLYSIVLFLSCEWECRSHCQHITI